MYVNAEIYNLKLNISTVNLKVDVNKVRQSRNNVFTSNVEFYKVDQSGSNVVNITSAKNLKNKFRDQ